MMMINKRPSGATPLFTLQGRSPPTLAALGKKVFTGANLDLAPSVNINQWRQVKLVLELYGPPDTHWGVVCSICVPETVIS